jgi:hypothetical protein
MVSESRDAIPVSPPKGPAFQWMDETATTRTANLRTLAPVAPAINLLDMNEQTTALEKPTTSSSSIPMDDHHQMFDSMNTVRPQICQVRPCGGTCVYDVVS